MHLAGLVRLDPGSLLVILVFGCIGEVVDLVGTATMQSNLIGAAILGAAVGADRIAELRSGAAVRGF